MWKKTLDNNITVLDLPELCDDRIMGLRLQLSNVSCITIFGVYLPSTNHDLDTYRAYICKLDELYHLYSPTSEVIFVGDFNAQVRGPRLNNDQINLNARTKALEKLFLDTECNSLMVQQFCHGPLFTFDPYGDGTSRSLIDHIVVQTSKFDLVQNCMVVVDHEKDCTCINVSDHLPVIACIQVGNLVHCPIVHAHNPRINWNKAKLVEFKEQYALVTNHNFECIINDIELDNSLSTNVNIDEYYDLFIATLATAANDTLPTSHYNPHLKP
jgi:hypothetical protein